MQFRLPEPDSRICGDDLIASLYDGGSSDMVLGVVSAGFVRDIGGFCCLAAKVYGARDGWQ